MVENNDPGTNEYPTIDFSKGMPAGSYDTYSKIYFVIGHENSPRDKTLYKKLRVAKYDYKDSNGETLFPNVQPGDYVFDCGANYTENGETDWRLPTQRELQAIWILQDELKSICNTFEYLASEYYWTSTYASTSWDNTYNGGAGGYTNAWTIYGGRTPPGGAGNAPHQLRTTPLKIRCVREIP
jgi:hypothetical protein